MPTVLQGHALDVLGGMADGIFHAVVTSPPYFGLRDYGAPGQIGLEKTPAEYVANLVTIFREVARVLRPDGSVWLNLGDSFADATRSSEKRAKDASGVVRASVEKTCERCGIVFKGAIGRRFCSAYCGGSDNSRRATRAASVKAKDLLGIPWRVAFALQADGWYLRAGIPWIKRNVMPESTQDRPTVAHEYLFLLGHPQSRGRYFYDPVAVRIPHAPGSVARSRRGVGITPYTNGAPGQTPQGYLRTQDASGIAPDGGRNRRTSDFFFDSLRAILDGEEGLLLDEGGEPLALVVNPQPCSWRYCAACDTLYEGKERGRIPKRPEGAPHDWKPPCPECGRTDGWVGHFAAFPERLVEPCILASCPSEGTVLDPFLGAGTTNVVADRLGRIGVGIEIRMEYARVAAARSR